VTSPELENTLLEARRTGRGGAVTLEHLVGRVIEHRYRIDALIGAGGMGVVFAGSHLLMKRDIAIKVLLPTLTAHDEVAARFEREAQAASRLEHPNIVRVFDFGAFRDAGVELKYLVMERLEGGELARRLGRPLPQSEARSIVRSVLLALAHAHARGVVHRDLKPENIFLVGGPDPAVKLVDFGIAKLLDGAPDETKLTRMGAIFGTPQYMSPEQAIGQEVDHRSDLYAVGLILYEMLRGAPAFVAEDVVALLRMQIQEPPAPIPGLQPSLCRLLDGLLAKDREARLQSADAALALLDAEAPSFRFALPAVLEQWPRARRLGAVAGALVIVGATVLALRGGGEVDAPQPTTSSAPAPRIVAAPEPELPPPGVRVLRDLVVAGKTEAALQEADALLRTHPQLAHVHWLKGDALTAVPERRAEMLTAYQGALSLDPRLPTDRDVYARLGGLMREKQVAPEVVELVLTADRKAVEPFVFELLNRKADILDFTQRHRLLATLPEQDDARLNRALNVTLDLWQAATETKPCRVFADTLSTMEADPRPEYVASLEQVLTPAPVGGNSPCEGLEARRAELARRFRLQFPEAPAWVPEGFAKRGKTRKRRRGFAGLFR